VIRKEIPDPPCFSGAPVLPVLLGGVCFSVGAPGTPLFSFSDPTLGDPFG